MKIMSVLAETADTGNSTCWAFANRFGSQRGLRPERLSNGPNHQDGRTGTVA